MRILEMNGKAARMLKYEREDLIGKNLSPVLMDSVRGIHSFKEFVKMPRPTTWNFSFIPVTG